MTVTIAQTRVHLVCPQDRSAKIQWHWPLGSDLVEVTAQGGRFQDGFYSIEEAAEIFHAALDAGWL